MLDITQTQVQRFHGPKQLSLFSEKDQEPKVISKRNLYIEHINEQLRKRHLALVSMPKNPNSTWRGCVFKSTSIAEYSRSFNRDGSQPAGQQQHPQNMCVRGGLKHQRGPSESLPKPPLGKEYSSPQTLLRECFQEYVKVLGGNVGSGPKGCMVLPPAGEEGTLYLEKRTSPILRPVLGRSLVPICVPAPGKYVAQMQPIPENAGEKLDLRIQRVLPRQQRPPPVRIDYSKPASISSSTKSKRTSSSAERQARPGQGSIQRDRPHEDSHHTRGKSRDGRDVTLPAKRGGVNVGKNSASAAATVAVSPIKRQAPVQDGTQEKRGTSAQKKSDVTSVAVAGTITNTIADTSLSRSNTEAPAPRKLQRYRAVPRPRQEEWSPPPQERLERKSKPVFLADESYSFVIAFGNNSGIIRRCFERRMDYWKEAPTFSRIFHFKWQPFSKGLIFDQLSLSQKQIVNHFECHHEVTTKDCLFRNMYVHAESKRVNVFDFVPITFLLDVDSESFCADLERFVHCYNILDSAKASANSEEAVRTINQKLSQFPIFGEKKIPPHSKAKLYPTHYAGQNIWILKPTGFNRGRGVSVFETVDRLKTLLRFYSEGVVENGAAELTAANSQSPTSVSAPATTMSNLNNLPSIIKSRAFVIQKYVERPLLIRDRKFDIRVWALVTQEMKLYFFKEGYIRTSCETYSIDSGSVEKRNVHLTNNAVQKFCENYGAFEDGNQLSFPQFQDYLNEKHADQHIDVYKNLVVQMKDLIKFSMMAVRRKLNPDDRKICFELFGYDFLIDEAFKVWLIEVNTNPCLEESSSILKMLLPRMIDDMLKLTVDCAFPRKRAHRDPEPKGEILYKVKGYPDNENMWELQCDLGVAGKKARGKATGANFRTVKDSIPPAVPQPVPEPVGGDNGT